MAVMAPAHPTAVAALLRVFEAPNVAPESLARLRADRPLARWTVDDVAHLQALAEGIRDGRRTLEEALAGAGPLSETSRGLLLNQIMQLERGLTGPEVGYLRLQHGGAPDLGSRTDQQLYRLKGALERAAGQAPAHALTP
jgi:hypothetical protein